MRSRPFLLPKSLALLSLLLSLLASVMIMESGLSRGRAEVVLLGLLLAAEPIYFSGLLQPSPPRLLCTNCPLWYGAEEYELGPCRIKLERRDARPLTRGDHECDEPEAIRRYREGTL